MKPNRLLNILIAICFTLTTMATFGNVKNLSEREKRINQEVALAEENLKIGISRLVQNVRDIQNKDEAREYLAAKLEEVNLSLEEVRVAQGQNLLANSESENAFNESINSFQNYFSKYHALASDPQNNPYQVANDLQLEMDHAGGILSIFFGFFILPSAIIMIAKAASMPLMMATSIALGRSTLDDYKPKNKR